MNFFNKACCTKGVPGESIYKGQLNSSRVKTMHLLYYHLLSVKQFISLEEASFRPGEKPRRARHVGPPAEKQQPYVISTTVS